LKQKREDIIVGGFELHRTKQVALPVLMFVALTACVWFVLPAAAGTERVLDICALVVGALAIASAIVSDVLLNKKIRSYERIAQRVEAFLVTYQTTVPTATLWRAVFPDERRGKSKAPPSWFTDYVLAALDMGHIASSDNGESVYANDMTHKIVQARGVLKAHCD
jgi:hypothetical protein